MIGDSYHQILFDFGRIGNLGPCSFMNELPLVHKFKPMPFAAVSGPAPRNGPLSGNSAIPNRRFRRRSCPTTRSGPDLGNPLRYPFELSSDHAGIFKSSNELRKDALLDAQMIV